MKAISKLPAFFPNYLDIESPDSIFTPAILKTWDPIHFQQCGWYLDCPVKKPPPFDIALRDSIQPMIPSLVALVLGNDSSTPSKGGSSKTKTVSKASNSQGSKRKVDDLVEDPMDEDILATCTDIVPTAELPDQIHSEPPRAHKRLCLGDPDHATPITFVPPAVKAMSYAMACTLSTASNRVLILNDSFYKMLDYKSKHNLFPSTYDDMVAFLTEVHIQIQLHSFRLASHLSIFHYILKYLCY